MKWVKKGQVLTAYIDPGKDPRLEMFPLIEHAWGKMPLKSVKCDMPVTCG